MASGTSANPALPTSMRCDRTAAWAALATGAPLPPSLDASTVGLIGRLVG